MVYLSVFLISFLLVVVFTPLTIYLVKRWGILDNPQSLTRKLHGQATPLLGGLAIFFSLVISSLLLIWWPGNIFSGSFLPQQLFGLVVGSIILLIGGVLDDKYNLKPKQQIIFTLLAVIIVLVSGVSIIGVTNPWGGTWSLFNWSIPVTVVWLLGMIYTAKFLDGLDGLLSGVTVIGGLVIFLLSLRPELNQPTLNNLALILAGAFLGFLLFNWSPAKIFLGESGSLLAGFWLGVLAILAGSKIATALLVMGLSIIDVAWVIGLRLKAGQSPFLGDRRHLHYRLLALGWPAQRIVQTYYLVSLAFGLAAIILPRPAKIIILAALILLVLFFEYWIDLRLKFKNRILGL